MTPEQLARINQQLKEQRELNSQRQAESARTKRQRAKEDKQIIEQRTLAFQEEQQRLIDSAWEGAMKRVQERRQQLLEIKNYDDLPTALYDYSF